MTYFVFSISHASSRAATSPSAQSIGEAFRMASLRQSNVGGWVGPAPRVTRKGGLIDNAMDPFGNHPQNQTTAVALYAVPDGTSLARAVAILTAVRDRVRLYLESIDGIDGTWGDLSVVRYAEAANGPLSWWESGAASRTRTSERFPVLTTDPDENPVGPTGSDTHPTTAAETLESMARQARQTAESGASLLWSAAGLGVVALVAYGIYAWQTTSRELPTRSSVGTTSR